MYLIALATRLRCSRSGSPLTKLLLRLTARSWLYAAIYLDTKLILNVELFGRHGTDPAAAFLHGLREKHDLFDAVFLVDQFGYRTVLSRLELNGQVDYTDRNLIKKWFRCSQCVLTVFIIRGLEVGRAHANGLTYSCITTTIRDRINHSVDERRLMRCLIRQCRSPQQYRDLSVNQLHYSWWNPFRLSMLRQTFLVRRFSQAF